MSKRTITIAVTGAAGQIGYALLPRLASGELFGSDVRINLRLIEIPAVLEHLEGVLMELHDCAFTPLDEILLTSDIDTGVEGADWVLLVGSLPRGIVIDGKKIQERSDLLHINGGIFTNQGRAIGERAKPDARVLVVGNPANTNALIGASHARQPGQHWLAMMALDANRARYQLAARAGVANAQVTNVCIWGNHSPTMYPDAWNARIDGHPAMEVIGDDGWVREQFLPDVQQRGKAIIDARGASSAASAASAAIDTVRRVEHPTAAGDWFSAAIASDGSYGVPEGLICGFPLRSDGAGSLEIVQGLEWNELARERINITLTELEEERNQVLAQLG